MKRTQISLELRPFKNNMMCPTLVVAAIVASIVSNAVTKTIEISIQVLQNNVGKNMLKWYLPKLSRLEKCGFEIFMIFEFFTFNVGEPANKRIWYRIFTIIIGDKP
eukprot:NODE_27_length_33950_cov_0.349739.p21 type:complete len:106 gc:universal NODE_27_length_33950_cov_0.349739:4852-5169(+)